MTPTAARSVHARSGHARAATLARALVLAAWAAAPLAAQGGPLGAVAAPGPLEPDTVIHPVGGPRMVLLRTPGEGVAALRLSVPFTEGRWEAGAGLVLLDLAVERMQALARPVGARVSGARTPWGVAYTVVGAAADFEYLAYLLREAVANPDGSPSSTLRDARQRLATQAVEVAESPRRRLATELRSQAAPGALVAEGTPGSVAVLDAARLRAFWERTHQASAMTLVVAAAVAPEVLLAATQGMGSPTAAAPPPDAPPPPEPRRGAAQTLRTWYGEAWSAPGAVSPEGAAAALLLSRHMEGARSAGIEMTVEVWELPDRWVLAVMGAAYARDAAAMRRAVTAALPGVRGALDGAAVAEAVARLRRERVLAERTPAGLVSAVGRSLEATGDPLAAARAADALERVDGAGVRALLDELLRRPPYTAQVRP